MMCAPEPLSSLRWNLRALAVVATLGLLILAAACLVAVPSAWPGPATSGAVAAGGFTCPSASANQFAVTLTTNVTSGPAPLTVQFCSASPHKVSSTLWSFGSNATSSAANTTFVFSSAGTYFVTLNVTYAQGGYSTASVVITATGAPPPFAVSASVTPRWGASPLLVNATTTAYNAVGSVTYSWAVTQDNLTWQTLTNASALNTTSFTLTLFGTWYVKSTATDSVGDTADAWSEVVVLSGSGNGTGGGGGGGNGTGNSSGAFSVYPVASPQEAPAPANVFFNASVAGGVAPYNFTWAFGDGGTGIGQWQEHVYTNPGTYLARVYVVDGAGVANNTTSLLIIVTGNQTTGNGSGLTFSFSGTPSRGTTPLNVSFKATATGGASPYSLVVCTTLGSCGFSIHNWSGELVTTFGLYTTQGNYTATATLTEANGNQTVATTPILVVAGTPLNVTYLESLSVGPPPLAVGFLATVSGGTGPYSIQWNWGDGTLSSSANGVIVAHAYTTVGVYSPTLAVSDAVGHNVTIRLGTVNVTAGGSPPTGKINGFLPTGGTATLDLEYLGIAAVGALISGIALGGYLQRRDRHREGDTLVRALESTASQSSGTTNEAEGKR